MKSSLEVLLKKDLPLRDVPQQQLHGDAQLGHVLLAEVVTTVEGEEACDGGEVDVGPDAVLVAGELADHEDRHAGEDGQGGEEDDEHAQDVLSALAQGAHVLRETRSGQIT